jgi:hypothetical protein
VHAKEGLGLDVVEEVADVLGVQGVCGHGPRSRTLASVRVHCANMPMGLIRAYIKVVPGESPVLSRFDCPSTHLLGS